MENQELEVIFEKNFKKQMFDKDIRGFKVNFRTLYKVIIESMKEAQENALKQDNQTEI